MRRVLLIGFIIIGIAILVVTGPPITFKPTRFVAITIDDLPATSAQDLAEMQALTDDLLAHLKKFEIPAIGFVNEGKLFAGDSAKIEAHTALLRRWLDAGLELGNHTYAHIDFQNSPLDSIKADILRGERILRPLLAEYDAVPRYFRHPFLHTGPDLQTRAAIDSFLAEKGYTVAPVTIDNSEWIYADAYDKALDRGDASLAHRIGSDYIRYMEEVFEFNEALSHDVVGREIKHVLLLHANRLNADYLDDVITMIRRRGYAFITLEEALQDSAYTLPDTYAGPRGLSWLQRWAISRGEAPREEPGPPEFVMEIHRTR